MKLERKIEWRDEFLPNGAKVKCEVIEWRDKDNGGRLEDVQKTIADVRYYNYLDLIDRYKQGLITMETLDLIVKGDGLGRFAKPEDFVLGKEGMTSEKIDANLKKTRDFEKRWFDIMKIQDANEKWSKVGSIIGEGIKSL